MELKQKVVWALGELGRGNNNIADELARAHLQWDGFVATILDVTLDNTQLPELRIAACVVIKDLVRLHLVELSPPEKDNLRKWAVEAPAVIHNPGTLLKLVKEVVFQLVNLEYPHNWPTLPETTYLRLTSARTLEEIRGVLMLVEAVVTCDSPRPTDSTVSWEEIGYLSTNCQL